MVRSVSKRRILSRPLPSEGPMANPSPRDEPPNTLALRQVVWLLGIATASTSLKKTSTIRGSK